MEKILTRKLDARAFVLDKNKNAVLIREKTIDKMLDMVTNRLPHAGSFHSLVALCQCVVTH